jgi:hypothetical protein
MFDCTPEELAVFSDIADGKPVENYSKEIIESLMKQNLLSEDAGMITVPALVWHQWQKHKDDPR